ncbi:tRNA-dependent cyclodipeptide synthase [Streptomyces sp. NPDC020742]|uniref:tRNA-dependent cyclodipeptide synthase n=1 Tax=unclassified Streptomyces TaxID=2593676 RepID=UPI003407D1DC
MEPEHIPDTVSGLRAEPMTEDCRLIWKRGDHALIGISGGNSYFNQYRLSALMQWAADHFAEIDVVYVDTHMEDLLIADGRSPEDAARSVRRTMKDVRRRIRRSLEGMGPRAALFRVRALSEFMDMEEYQKIRERAEHALRDDREFSAACDRMVHQVMLNKKGDPSTISPEYMQAGRKYVLAEAPLFIDSPAIFDVPSSTLLYHLRTPVTECLAWDQSGFRAAREQGYVVVGPPPENTD